MKTIRQRGRHGDLAITRLVEIPSDIARLDTTILMAGEATGHNHEIISYEPGQIEIFEATRMTGARLMEKIKYLQVKYGSVILTHPEHKEISVTEGFYSVTIEKEFDPFLKYYPQVRD